MGITFPRVYLAQLLPEYYKTLMNLRNSKYCLYNN